VITSPSNKRVAKAFRLKKRGIRDQERRFLVEGVPAISEAIDSPATVHGIFHGGSADERVSAVLTRARGAGISVLELSEELMRRLTSTVTPQGIVAVVDFVDVPVEELARDAACVAVLAEVRDPGNAGTIVRSADASGADGVVFSTASVDLYNEKAVRATAGSLFHVPVAREVPLDMAVGALRDQGLRILAATAQGSRSIHETDLARPTAILFGNEAHGLSSESLEQADDTIRVPIYGRAESLNLAAAAATVLFESARQRREGLPLSSIVAGAAHDIRSPLASMLGFAHTLLSRWENLDEEQKRAMVQTMAFDGGRMRTLVAQLVDAARLSSGGMELSLQPIDLLAVARKVGAESSHAELSLVEVGGDEVRVTADPKRLEVILAALVEAGRWYGSEGPVIVTVRAEPAPVVEVRRSGARVDAPAARDLFSPREAGTGGGSKLGLYVAKGLADAHGAALEADGGDGITFLLTFPRP
jgi:RNA methyltransferase, TrmH family